ncbi:unnamed protein product, partial [Closterium sp. NIES-53]
FELEFLAVASPSKCAMLLSSEGDPDALDIPTPRTYREANQGSTYVHAVPPPRTNVVDGMWIFKVKRPPGSPPVFKARYVARGFSQREGFDFFHTFTLTPKMTTLRVLLHIAAQRDYELHSLDFSTSFLQACIHKEILLRRPPGFTGTFPPGTQWSLRRPVYGLRQAPREWHDMLRITLAYPGFRPSSANPSLFVRRGSTPFFFLVYVKYLVFATAYRAALTEVLQRFRPQFSITQPTPIAVNHRLTDPFPDELFESSGPYAELVGCLMYLMTCTPLSILSHFVATMRHRPMHWMAAVRLAKHLSTTSGVWLVLGGRQPVVLTGHCDSSYADDVETQLSTQRHCFSLGAGAVSWRFTRSSSVAQSSAEAEIYAGAMAAQELRWLTFLLTDLGKQPCSAPTLFTDNKAMILLC